MPKINKEEYELLISIVFYWKWIARDRDGRLHKFHGKPEKVDSFRWNDRKQTWLGMSSDRFQFVQWEDEEPYNVTELIEEYGEAQRNYSKNESYEQFYKESEETEMKKDLDWLNNELEKVIKDVESDDISFAGKKDYDEGYIDSIRDVQSIVNQLNEPETFEETIHLLENVLKENKRLGELLEEKHEEWLELMDEINNRETETLTPEWIDDNSVYASSDGVTEEYVHVDDLQNLLVPKQELPVIPEFAADFLNGKEDYALYELLNSDIIYDDYDRLARWLYDSDDETNREREFRLVLAHVYGYELETEQRYYVYLGDGQYLVSEGELKEHYAKIRHEEDSGFSNCVLTFTEQEIKDYDERYWPFRKPVEELEE